ncbi:hypothetical protein OpiT1DRAFT_04937 [Opitutaceae bacterium TAV1]|nr:hypothetical protein OpiT1DRAFT_04937 [Opitutaceae bacterium TAV1]
MDTTLKIKCTYIVICMIGGLGLAGCICVDKEVRSRKPKAIYMSTIAGINYKMELSDGMKRRSLYEPSDISTPSYAFFIGHPWSPGMLTEEQYANKIIITYFTTYQYGLQKKGAGLAPFPDLYADAFDTYHADVTHYDFSGGRGTILRYDVQHETGIFCLSAIVLHTKKYASSFNRDVETMQMTLKSFSIVP